MAITLDPIKIAARFEPPSLALLYKKEGNQFLHEFPIPAQALGEDTEDLYEEIANMHPGYLENIEPDQVMDLIDKIKEYYIMDENQLDFLTREVEGMNLGSDDSGMLDDDDLDFDDIEKEMGRFSFNGKKDINSSF